MVMVGAHYPQSALEISSCPRSAKSIVPTGVYSSSFITALCNLVGFRENLCQAKFPEYILDWQQTLAKGNKVALEINRAVNALFQFVGFTIACM